MPENLSYKNHIEHYQLDAEVADYFNPNRNEKQAIRRRYQHFEKLLKPRDGQFVLEIGSGGGEALNILKDRSLSYYPVDLSLKNLNKIKQKHPVLTKPVFADCFELPFKKNSFDLIIMSEVLEHLQRPQDALDELYRVLKAGGRAVISVPYKEKITYQLCIHCNQLTPTHAHLHSFDENRLIEWTEKSGFDFLKADKINNKLAALIQLPRFLSFLPYSLYKALDNTMNLIIPKTSHLLALLSKKQ